MIGRPDEVAGCVAEARAGWPSALAGVAAGSAGLFAACPPPQAAMAPKNTTPQARETVNMMFDVFMTIFLSA